MLIAANPDPDSTLPYLLRLPLGGGMVFRTSGTWPRTKALYCHPVPLTDWPQDAEVLERVELRSLVRRGAAIDLILDRGRENRSQIVFTTARGRDVVFWQSPRTRNSPARTWPPPPPAPPASMGWRSSSTPTSSTPTASPTNRSPRSNRPCPAGTTGSASTGHWWPRWNANPSSTSSPASSTAHCATPWPNSPPYPAPPWWSRTATPGSSNSTGSAPR